MIERKTVSQCPTSDYCRGWNDAVDAMPKWISTEEALPEICKKVLVAIPHGKYRYKLHVGERWNECWWVEAAKWNNDYIKFWCELPEPPKKEAD